MRDDWQIAKKPLRKVRPERSPYVSLNKRGEIVINPAAWGEMGETYNVTLLYRPPPTTPSAKRRHHSSGRKGAIGIKFPVAGDDHFFAVCRYGRGRKLRVIRAARLLKQFGIEIDKTLVFVRPEVVRFDGVPMIVLELDQARPIAQQHSC